MKGGERKRSYAQELALLPKAFEQFRGHSVPELEHWTNQARRGSAIFVASGGALAVARLAADLHEHATGEMAKALTPLEFARTALRPDTAVLLLSAGARHPDVLVAARAASARGNRPFGLVTLRPPSELPPALRKNGLQAIVLPALPGREGFLATTSVLCMATAIARVYTGSEDVLPPTLRVFTHPVVGVLSRNSLILSAPGYASAAIDLETRMSELGLSSLQMTDYRNFAHGRHAGFSKQLAETSVVALIAPEFRRLAEATLGQFPAGAEIHRIETNEVWPASAIEILVGSMQLTGCTAEARRVEPARPGVPAFGRRLYHLTSRDSTPPPSLGPVEKKALASGAWPSDLGLREGYEEALNRWLEVLGKTDIRGLVLDYDGTCCETSERFGPTPITVQGELTRLLAAGCVVGFASGRGQSLHRDLREWIPSAHWSDIVLGLYNGSLILTLNDAVPDQSECIGDLAEAASRLESSPLGHLMKVERRAFQVTVEAPSGARITGGSLASATEEIIARAPRLDLKVVASAHSADIVPWNSGKADVLEAVRARVGEGVLAIGDRGHVGGNDFELLAATPLSLSVDRCSADPTRCWNLGATGERGPLLLIRYLKALRPRSVAFRFSVQRFRTALAKAPSKADAPSTQPRRGSRSK